MTDHNSASPAAPHRQYWATRLGVILAVAGSAVGLGNFVRFPAQAVEYGGIFMIPYFVAFILIGLPIVWSEWAMGRFGGMRGFNSAPGIFSILYPRPGKSLIGGWSLMIPVGIYSYYVFIEAWCLAYALKYLFGVMPGTVALDEGGETASAAAYFLHMVGYGENGQVFGVDGAFLLACVAFCFAINLVLIIRGLNRGIEWFCRWAMPLLVLVALIVLVRVLTLGSPVAAAPERNVLTGLGFMWNPDGGEEHWWRQLLNAQIWMAATSQIFFSLSIGLGVIVCYASYLRRRDDVALSSTAAAAGNGFCEVALGGLIVIPAIFIFLGADQVQGLGGSTLGTGFMALPSVFAEMPAGRVFGFLFFFLLFLAAVTSSISMLQPGIAFLEEGLHLRRFQAAGILAVPTLIGVLLVMWYSANLVVLDTVDFWLATFGIFMLAMTQLLIFTFSLGIRRGLAALREGSQVGIPSWVGVLIGVVAPLYLSVIFITWLYQQITATEGNRFHALAQGPVLVGFGFVLALLIGFTLLSWIANRRWRAQAAAGLIPDPRMALVSEPEEDAP
ncbi:MAG: sodium:calcium symporter [Planctomycetota bacterium]|nr:MAG: sodium:calcium symporter [Planctomycetota bacterium]